MIFGVFVSNRAMWDRRGRSGSRYLSWNGMLRSTTAVAVAAVAIFVAGCGGEHRPDGVRSAGTASESPAGGKPPQATTFTDLGGIPTDTAAAADGTVVHPIAPLPVSATPGGPPVAILPEKELGGPTWVPVVETRPGWQRVLLPSRPNGAVGWITTAGGKVQTAHTSARRLQLLKSGRPAGTWTVAVGAPKTPTPPGRTFILASLAPAKATYSPLILPVGAHSESLDSFGGGPGTVAFHGWPQKSVFGHAVTHGCVRVPADALRQLSQVPLGTPVSISS
jgi:hypothetical protein